MMILKTTARGFNCIVDDEGKRVIQESSLIGDYDDSAANPGSSYLLLYECHINREQTEQLIKYLQNWLSNKKLS